MLQLTASLAAMAVGPLLGWRFGTRRRLLEALDGFLVAMIAGLVLGEILPGTVASAGVWALVAGLAGLALPGLLDRAWHQVGRAAHPLFLGLAILGVALHAALDGAALVDLPTASGRELALAVILHRIPVGVLIWWMIAPRQGRAVALLTLAGISAATVGGYLLGESHFAVASTGAFGVFQAFVGGLLLHVLFHDGLPSLGTGHEHHHHDHDAPHDPIHDEPGHDEPGHDEPGHDEPGHETGHDDHDHAHDHPAPAEPPARPQWPSAIGGMIGLGTLYAMQFGHDHGGGDHAFWGTFVRLAAESAPALLLAFVFAGLVMGLLGSGSLRWLSRGGPLGQAARGVAFGLPLPICSCGVLPVYESLLLRGAPATGALAFLVATPELGLDAVLLSLPLLGAEITLARVLCALIVALVVAVVVGRMVPPAPAPAPAPTEPDRPAGARIREGLRFAFGDLADHTLPWILVGLLVAALAEQLLDPAVVAGWPGWATVPAFALLGLPAYVCASGATPFAAVLIAAGVGPGAAIAFLLTGPATNVTTFGVLRRLHGVRVATAFGGAVAGLAIGLGYAVDALIAPAVGALDGAHAHGLTLFEAVTLGALGLVFVASMARQGPRGMVAQVAEGNG